jgi:hypothetical protein
VSQAPGIDCVVPYPSLTQAARARYNQCGGDRAPTLGGRELAIEARRTATAPPQRGFDREAAAATCAARSLAGDRFAGERVALSTT